VARYYSWGIRIPPRIYQASRRNEQGGEMDIFIYASMIAASLSLLSIAVLVDTGNIVSAFWFKFIPVVLAVCLAISVYHMMVVR